MPLSEVVKAFNAHVENFIPSRFIDLHATPISLVERDAIKREYVAAIESITEAEIEQHTSYANQHRADVIQTIVKGVVKYAVLSHIWREGLEFNYQRMISPHSVRDGPGWSKLDQFVRLAKDTFKCRFAWADTVCIDPETPGDKQAAARSCFYWFRHAYVCIVYLASTRCLSELEQDKWFRRGWPLVELLAPIRIKFYGAGWEPLNVGSPEAENDKADSNFLDALSKASGISVGDLRSFLPGSNRVREKLSWASRRETSTPHDTAYCLISIFVSHMEIDPEEGEKAFLRLMLHIIPKSGECDVFAWAGQRAKDHPAIPFSPTCYGTQHRDRELHPDTHHYRLCGDRSFSLGYDHLKIKVIFIDIVLNWAWWTGYTVKSHSHRAFIDKVEPLSKVGAQMAIGVIDYDWTNEPGKGELRIGEYYFGFLLQRCSEQTRWEKVDTEKVVFLDSKETKKYELRVLDLLC
ncbi:hypothetical protein OG21DRAFT_1461779 [Imleria badia]|nr:hypothetical protein OG21DRAFT_1461779 [Imleria badia]